MANKDGEINVNEGLVVRIVKFDADELASMVDSDAGEIKEHVSFAKVQHGLTGKIGIIPCDCLDEEQFAGWVLNNILSTRATDRHEEAMAIIEKYSGISEVIDAHIPALKVSV